jgi:16S rRNA (cytosine967-C5)-methyltransferase
MSSGLDSRQAAYELLHQVATDDAYANLALPNIIRRFRLDTRDAGFTTELAMGTLRWRGFLDAVISQASDRPIDRIDPPVRDVLRLGAYQILFMRVPDHAAVSSAVDLVGVVKFRSAGGFVNATLRRVSESTLEEWRQRAAASVEDPTDRLALLWSHARWQVTALRDALGNRKHELEALLEVDNQSPSITGVSRTGDAGVEALLAAGGEAGQWSPYAVTVHRDPHEISAIRRGECGVQDEGSQLVALTLATANIDGPDQQWLDLCSGPGGKAALLKFLASTRNATLTAVELQEHRAALVERALAPLAGQHRVVTADGRDPQFATGSFDRVLVDAPCTGLGVLRRRAESRWRRAASDVAPLAKLQRQLLTNAMSAVRPGGVVVYATCSPHLAETEFVVEDILDAVPGARLLNAVEATLSIPGLRNVDKFRADAGDGPYVRLWPHIHGTDGMFLALLTRD